MTTDYRLALTRTAAGLQGTWITPAGVGTPFPLVSPVSGEDAQEHRWYLEEYLRFPGERPKQVLPASWTVASIRPQQVPSGRRRAKLTQRSVGRSGPGPRSVRA